MRSKGGAVDAIRAADAAWLKAFIKKGLDASAAFLDKHSAMLGPNARIVTGKRTITKLISAGFTRNNYKLTWRADKAGVARSGELGYTSRKYIVSVKGASGKSIFEKGKSLTVWKKQKDGAWKALFDMNHSDLPPSSLL